MEDELYFSLLNCFVVQEVCMRNKTMQPIYPRTCLRCGHGPYIPRKPKSPDCPKCHMPYNSKAVRNTRAPEPKVRKHASSTKEKTRGTVEARRSRK